MSMGIPGVLLCEGAAWTSAGGGRWTVGREGFSGSRWSVKPRDDVSMESSVLIDLDFEDRERVDWEEVVDLFLHYFLIARFFLPVLLFAFPILIGLVVLV